MEWHSYPDPHYAERFITLKVFGREFRCQRDLLASVSKYFQNLLAANKDVTTLCLDVPLPEFSFIYLYIHSRNNSNGNINFDGFNLEKVLKLAKKFQMQELEDLIHGEIALKGFDSMNLVESPEEEEEEKRINVWNMSKFEKITLGIPKFHQLEKNPDTEGGLHTKKYLIGWMGCTFNAIKRETNEVIKGFRIRLWDYNQQTQSFYVKRLSRSDEWLDVATFKHAHGWVEYWFTEEMRRDMIKFRIFAFEDCQFLVVVCFDELY